MQDVYIAYFEVSSYNRPCYLNTTIRIPNPKEHDSYLCNKFHLQKYLRIQMWIL